MDLLLGALVATAVGVLLGLAVLVVLPSAILVGLVMAAAGAVMFPSALIRAVNGTAGRKIGRRWRIRIRP